MDDWTSTAATPDPAQHGPQGAESSYAGVDESPLDSITVINVYRTALRSPAPSMPPLGTTSELSPPPHRAASFEPSSGPHSAIPPLSSQTEAVVAQVRALSRDRDQQLADAAAVAGFQLPPLAAHDAPAPVETISPAPLPHTPGSAASRTGGRRGRGPRRRLTPPTPHIADHASASTASTPSSTSRRGASLGGRPRGGRARGGRSGRASLGKRKRSSDEGEDDDDDDDANASDYSGATASSEEITTLPSTSRSGRRIISTAAASAAQSPPTITLDPPSTPVRALQAGQDSAPGSAASRTQGIRPIPMKPPSAKKMKRTPGASSVCKNCGRGHSPASNPIAFCDGCNAAWHRFCHDPPIRADALASVERDWFCADCVLLREHGAVLRGKVAGHGMSVAEKRKYLKTLTPGTLVTLLLHATALHPGLPIYPPKPQLFTIDAAAAEQVAAAGGDEVFELVDDELPYPRAGNGVQLPPEGAHLDLLVDDDVAVYSHRWTGIGDMVAAAGWPARNGSGVRTGNAGVGIRAGA